jgi:predicted HicB family RNase H-like nuclease
MRGKKGGKREGSGRKKAFSQKTHITLYLEKEDKKKLSLYAKAKGISVPALLREAIISLINT